MLTVRSLRRSAFSLAEVRITYTLVVWPDYLLRSDPLIDSLAAAATYANRTST